MPISAASHIQKTAPYPPSAIACVVPTMLPVPTVADSAVETAWKGVTAPSPAFCLENIFPIVFFSA